MSLIYLDDDSDPWITDQETCERVYQEIVEQLNSRSFLSINSEEYAAASASIRLRMKQFSAQVDQLKTRLDSHFSLTYEEAERRNRLIETLRSKHVVLQKRFKEWNSSYNANKKELFDESSSAAPWSEDVNEPLLQNREPKSVDELRAERDRMLTDQDRGLENLSQVISRQKDIALAIGSEVDIQTNMVSDIAERMERTNANIQRETVHVRVVSRKDSTWGYWLVILILFGAIVTVALV